MERERKAFDAFVRLHANKATATDTPVAHMQFWREDFRSASDPLLAMDVEDVLSELDRDSESVRWLLRQLHTYDCSRQKIVGLIFNKHTVVSDVFWVTREVDATS